MGHLYSADILPQDMGHFTQLTFFHSIRTFYSADILPQDMGHLTQLTFFHRIWNIFSADFLPQDMGHFSQAVSTGYGTLFSADNVSTTTVWATFFAADSFPIDMEIFFSKNFTQGLGLIILS